MAYFGRVYEPILNLLWETTSVNIFGRQYYFEPPEHGRQQVYIDICIYDNKERRIVYFRKQLVYPGTGIMYLTHSL